MARSKPNLAELFMRIGIGIVERFVVVVLEVLFDKPDLTTFKSG